MKIFTLVPCIWGGGNERPEDYSISGSWKHLFDFHTRFNISKRLQFMTQFIPGFETTNLGTNKFLFNAIYFKYNFSESTNLAFSYEHLFEQLFSGSESNFLETFDSDNKAWLYGFTSTFSHILVKNHLMIRLEYRYDLGTQNWFYRGTLPPSGNDYAPYLTNAKLQNTLSFSVVGWF